MTCISCMHSWIDSQLNNSVLQLRCVDCGALISDQDLKAVATQEQFDRYVNGRTVLLETLSPLTALDTGALWASLYSNPIRNLDGVWLPVAAPANCMETQKADQSLPALGPRLDLAQHATRHGTRTKYVRSSKQDAKQSPSERTHL